MTGQLRRRIPAAGLEHALLVGHRRRRRATTAGVAGLAVVAVLAVSGVLALRSGEPSTYQLDVTGVPADRPGSPSPQPSPDSREPLGRNESSDRQNLTVVSPSSPVPTAPPRQPVTRYAKDGGPVMSGPGKVEDLSQCEGQALWVSCSPLTGPDEMTAGTTEQFTFWVCRNKAAIRETVHFDTRQEAEFVLTDGHDVERWRWSRGFTFPTEQHQMDLEGGYCYTWTVDWAGLDEAGHTLPPGTYTMKAYGWATEWRPPEPGDPEPGRKEVHIVGG